MGIFDFVKEGAKGLLEPIGAIVDNLHTSHEEKLILKAQLAQTQADLESRLYESETARLAAVNASIQIEAKSDNKLTSSWRPLFGISFGLQMWMMFMLLIFKDGAVELIGGLPDLYWFSNLAVLGVVAGGRTWEKVAAKRNGGG